LKKSYEELRNFNNSLLEAISRGLGFESNRLTDFTKNAFCTMRFLHYVARELSEKENSFINEDGDIVRGGEHTDTFINTLILSRQPGLRIRKNEDHVWHKVPIIDEGKAILFFGADALEILTNGKIKAGVHQVIIDKSLINGLHVSPRLSIGLFNYANFDLTISPFVEYLKYAPMNYPPTTQYHLSKNAYDQKFTLTYNTGKE